MVTIRSVSPDDARSIMEKHFAGTRQPASPAEHCEAEDLVIAFVAERDRNVVGLATAESHPRVVHVVNLEGDIEACRALLELMVRRAGERSLTAWVAVARTDLLALVEARGFSREFDADFQGRPACLYQYQCDPVGEGD